MDRIDAEVVAILDRFEELVIEPRDEAVIEAVGARDAPAASWITSDARTALPTLQW